MKADVSSMEELSGQSVGPSARKRERAIPRKNLERGALLPLLSPRGWCLGRGRSAGPLHPGLALVPCA